MAYIPAGAFSGCGSLESITLPFIGSSVTPADGTYVALGHIFGSTAYEGSVETVHDCLRWDDALNGGFVVSVTRHIPASLKSVTITGGKIRTGAFTNCSNLTKIILRTNVTYISKSAFYGCWSLTSLQIPFVGSDINGTNFTKFSNFFLSLK